MSDNAEGKAKEGSHVSDESIPEEPITAAQMEREFYAEESNTLETWNKLRKVPPAAQSKITGKRYQGTSIKGMWRILQLTKVYGPYGVGWYYEVVSKWIDAVANGAALLNVEIILRVKHGNEWSMGAPGIGTAFIIAKESAGLRSDEDVYKKAATTALAQASKLLGVGADIYMGHPEDEYMDQYINSYDDLPGYMKILAKNANCDPESDELKHQQFLDYCNRYKWNLDLISSMLSKSITDGRG